MSQHIQCPACRRKFQARDDLTGKIVECGACDHRFSVSLEHVIHEKRKFYPGEHADAGLEGFGRMPIREDLPVNFQTASYTEQPDPAVIQPPSYGQSVALTAGLFGIIGFTLLFLLASGEGQAFTDVDLFQRLTLGAFVSIIGSALIIFGAKNWKARAGVLSVVLSSGLLALIYFRPIHFTPSSHQTNVAVSEETGRALSPRDTGEEKSDEEEYLLKIGHSKIIEFVERNTDPDKGIDGRQRVIGIYAHPVTNSSYNTIESYLKRRLSLDSDIPIYRYKRNDSKDSLIVIAGTRLNFDLVAGVCEQLGNVATLPSRRVIDLGVSKTVFSDPSPEEMRKLIEPENELFCISNLNEMDHPNIDRVISAVQRLTQIPDEVQMRYKPKIASRLATLIATEQDEELIEECGKALRKWGKDNPAIVKDLTTSVMKQLEKEETLSRSLVHFLIENQSEKSLVIVDRIWSKNPNQWSEQYISLGAQAEERLLFHFQNSPDNLRNNAVVLLRRVGTQKSIPPLQKALRGTNDGFDISIQRAIDSINAR